MTADGDAVEDDDILIFVNSWWEPLKFQTPADVSARSWEVVCDTSTLHGRVQPRGPSMSERGQFSSCARPAAATSRCNGRRRAEMVCFPEIRGRRKLVAREIVQPRRRP